MKPTSFPTPAPASQYRFHCDFGETHQISESCDCMERYRIFPIQYRMAFRELGYVYAKDVPLSVKFEILAKIPKF